LRGGKRRGEHANAWYSKGVQKGSVRTSGPLNGRIKDERKEKRRDRKKTTQRLVCLKDHKQEKIGEKKGKKLQERR